MIAAGEGDNDLHLRTLSSLAQNLMEDDYINAILQSKNEKEVVRLLNGEVEICH